MHWYIAEDPSDVDEQELDVDEYLECESWRSPLIDDVLVRHAAKHNNPALLEWLFSIELTDESWEIEYCANSAAMLCARRGLLRNLKILWRFDLVHNLFPITEAGIGGHPETVKWLYSVSTDYATSMQLGIYNRKILFEPYLVIQIQH